MYCGYNKEELHTFLTIHECIINLGCPLDVFRVLRNLKEAEVSISTRTTG